MWWILIKLAWRNLFRNTRRTFIAGTAIGIGLAALIFVDALWIGMEENMIRIATSSFLGDGQIHQEDFRQTQEVERTINQHHQVMSNLKQEEVVAHFTPRTFAFGMITSPAHVIAVALVGVDPVTEKYLSHVDEMITEGVYFEGEDERNIVIGSKMAEVLEVEIGDRVVATVSQAKTGDLAQEMFRISGVFHFHNHEMNRGMAFIRLEKSQQILGLKDDVHQIAIKFTDVKYGQDKLLPFWSKYSKYGNEAVSWTEILPELETIFEWTNVSKVLLGFVFFIIVVFGIINTLFMSLYERMFEFGVLRAIGTRPSRMAQLILFEAGSLGVLSIGIGIILGVITTYICSKTGIDYTGIEVAGVTIQELIYPVMVIDQFIFYPFWVLVFTTITGLYPAWYAARMSPAEAMRRVG